MGARLKIIGKVLIVMALAMFLFAPLVRSGETRIVSASLDHAVAPAYRFLLAHISPPVADAAMFFYVCALTLGAAGVLTSVAGYCWRTVKAG